MPNPWYILTEEERIKEYYSKFTIKDFWEWWSGGEQKVMEVRIKDFNIIKQVAEEYGLPFSASGIYVWTDTQLKTIIGRVRNQTTIWFGVNPRKKNYNKFGWKSFEGKDTNTQEISFLMIDIDRVEKTQQANNIELENCNKLADIILQRLETQGWNKNYIKICSGNGVQLLIKLDFPIKMPEVDFDNKNKVFTFNKDFDKSKQLIAKGIGNDILKFSRKYKDELGVEVDKACFNISRVASLPFTKNYKYGGFTWRGIIEIKKEINTGFSDYILSKEEDIEVYNEKNVFSTRALKSDNRIKQGKLKNNILIKFMLENDLPAGMRNNYLWFQVKCLLRDSGYDINTDEFRAIHKELEKKYGGLPSNLPDKKFTFDENIVNRYCIENMFPPLYDLWPKRTKKMNYLIDDISWDSIDLEKGIMELDEHNDIIKDMDILKKLLKEGNLSNIENFKKFVNGCIKKYGRDKAKYYFDFILKRYLIYN